MNISWSASRYRIFEECLRKYYYTYYRWNDPVIKRYRTLTAMPLWVGNSVHDAIEKWVKMEVRPKPEDWIAHTLDNMKAFFGASAAGCDGRLQEHEYGVPISTLTKQIAAGNVITSMRNALNGPVVAEMDLVGRENWLSVEQREEFTVLSPESRQAKAIVKMDAAYRAGDIIKVVDWKTGRIMHAKDEAQIGYYALFAFRAGWTPDPTKIQTTLAYISLGEVKARTPTWTDLATATKEIGAAFDAMARADEKRGDDEGNWHQRGGWACRSCPFRGPCNPEKSA